MPQEYAATYVHVMRSAATRSKHIQIPVVFSFNYGDAAGVEAAVARLAASKYNIIFSLVSHHDLEAMMRAADQHGLLSDSYVWLTADTLNEMSPLATSDPTFVGAAMHGMLQLEATGADNPGYERLRGVFASLAPADCNDGRFQMPASLFQQGLGTNAHS